MNLQFGAAVRMTTNGVVTEVYRIATHRCIDTFSGEVYEPDLISVPPIDRSIPEPTYPVSTLPNVTIAVANRMGWIYAAISAGVMFEGADVEVFLVDGEEFSTEPGSPDEFWSASIDDQGIDLNDDIGSFTVVPGFSRVSGMQLPREFVSEDDYGNAPQASLGRLLPFRFGFWFNGNRYSEAICIDRGNPGTGARPVIKISSTLDAEGNDTLKTGVINDTPNGGHAAIDGNFWLIARSKFSTDQIKWMASHSNPDRRTIPGNAVTNPHATKFTVKLSPTLLTPMEIIVTDDNDESSAGQAPCDFVETTPVEDPEDPDATIEEQCPTTNPVEAHDSQGGRIAMDFDPENDVVLCKHGGLFYWTPDGVGGSHAMHCGTIGWLLAAKAAGLEEKYFYNPSWFLASQWASGTQAELTYKNIGQLQEQKTLQDWLALLAWENGAVIGDRAGKLELRRFNPLGAASGAVYAIDPSKVKVGTFRVLPGRWGTLYNDVTFSAFGHSLDPDQLPYAVAHLKNQESIDTPGIGLRPYKYRGWFLDGREKDAFRARGGEMLEVLSARHLLIQLELQPPTAEARTVVGIKIGDYTSIWWGDDPSYGPARQRAPLISQENPATALVIGCAPDPVSRNNTLTLLIFLGSGGDQCTFATYTDEEPVFPISLSGETGYGDGDASVWNPDWSPRLKGYARCHFAYYADESGRVDPSDPATTNISNYSV